MNGVQIFSEVHHESKKRKFIDNSKSRMACGGIQYSSYRNQILFRICYDFKPAPSAVVFLIFWFMVFYKLTVKHTDRIQKYEEELQFFLKFFDIKSFCIMAFMMIFGISIRSFNLAPDVFIAVFYTGLGTALFGAGLLFGRNYYKYKQH